MSSLGPEVAVEAAAWDDGVARTALNRRATRPRTGTESTLLHPRTRFATHTTLGPERGWFVPGDDGPLWLPAGLTLAQTLRELREQQRLLGLSHHLVRKLQKLIDRLP